MQKITKSFVLATFLLIDTIIGVGIFGVPFVIMKIGPWLALVFFFGLGLIQLLQHLYLCEAALLEGGKAHIVGLADRFLGRRARHVTAVSNVLGFWAAMLAYILVGGTLLQVLLGPVFGGNVFMYRLIWGLVGAAVIFMNVRVIAGVSFMATISMLAALVAVFWVGIPHVQLSNVTQFGSFDALLPYGVILFSLGGIGAIPEMKELLGGDGRLLKKAVITGTVISIIITAAFGFVILGVSGATTTEDSVSGLLPILGAGITFIMAVFGFLAVSTSYITTGMNLRFMFQYDYKTRPLTACLFATAVPFVIMLIGSKSFIQVIGWSGAVFGGVTAIIIALLNLKITRSTEAGKRLLAIPSWMAYVSITVLGTGAAAEIYYSIFR